MYAVIDVETTGLRTSWHDRVVEIAVIHLDDRGRVQDQWCTLVNPDRDLGPQHIHGISAAEARLAPGFHDVAGEVVRRLKGRTLVAHNLHFDTGFIAAEYRRLGITAPVDPGMGLCTMRLAPHFLPAAGRSLQDCRRAAGLPPHQAHSALHDARAAADLVGFYLSATGTPPPWADVVARAACVPWPDLPPSTVAPVQRDSPGARPRHFLTRLVDRLPRQREPRADAYLDLLDRALLDRHISANEADALVETAEEIGLARADVAFLHEQYLTQLAELALADHVLTASERHDLDAVAALLGLADDAVELALKAAAARPRQGGEPMETSRWQLRRDDLVVFTGTMNPSRDDWRETALLGGLRVGDNVTKKTKLLVAADPDSMSGKAKLARRYGIPVVHPAAFAQMLRTLSGR